VVSALGRALGLPEALGRELGIEGRNAAPIRALGRRNAPTPAAKILSPALSIRRVLVRRAV
jgi:hypothetical protein